VGAKILIRRSLRLAVVGLGKMGLLHSSILNIMSNVELVGLCDRSFLIRKFVGKLFNGVQVLGNVEGLSDLDLDAVYITTPISSHYVVAKTVYSNNIARNLFVEKTLASRYEEAKEICEMAERAGGTNMVGYVRRFAVTYMEAKNLLDQGAIGQVECFKAYAYSSDFAKSARNSRSVNTVGVLRDLGCYALDLALWFFGDLDVVLAKLKSASSGSCEDSAHFTVERRDGLEGEFDVSWCMDNYRMAEVGFSISGTEGVIEVDDDKLKLTHFDGKSSIRHRVDLSDNVPFNLGGPEYYREDENFVKSAIEGRKTEPCLYTASKVDQIIDQMRNRADKNE
jgi:predicted dehydrogenase